MVLYTVALIIHVVICVALVLVILSQTSKGGLDANLGGAAMNVFGGSGASKFLRKWTQILGVLFVVSCIFLAFQVRSVGRTRTPRVLEETFGDNEAPVAEQPAPGVVPSPESNPVE
ncbi:MAG: preprotein translocase subunit SecG [Candidatus Syntrophosphaera sp.]|nr:preprotein translocase subunit SecG [Candidatus Syntrophosphaera sp.]